MMYKEKKTVWTGSECTIGSFHACFRSRPLQIDHLAFGLFEVTWPETCTDKSNNTLWTMFQLILVTQELSLTNTHAFFEKTCVKDRLKQIDS